MKDKLKILFGVLRSLGSEFIDTYMTIENNYIFEWDEMFMLSNGKEIKLPNIITETLEMVIDNTMSEFAKYNDYSLTDMWSLYVEIYPFENTIKFRSECAYANEETYTYKINLTEPIKKTTNKNIIDKVRYIFDNILTDDEDGDKLLIKFNGNNDNIDINDIEVDDSEIYINERVFIEFVDYFMESITNPGWDSSNLGMKGEIIIEKDKSILINYTKFEEVWGPTDMDLKITFNNER